MDNEITKITNFPPKIGSVCGNVWSRYTMTTVDVSKSTFGDFGAWLSTTDGHMAVAVAVDIEGPIPPNTIPKAVLGKAGTITYDGRWFGPNNVWSEPESVAPAPPIHEVLHEIDPDSVIAVSFNAGKLHRLAKALDADDDKVTLIIHKGDLGTGERTKGQAGRSIGVVALNSGTVGAGVLMECEREASIELDKYTKARDAYVKDHKG